MPGAVPPPKQKRSFPWTQAATLPVPKPARTFPRRRGQDPFADIVAGVQNLIQNIGKGTSRVPLSLDTSVRSHMPMTLRCRVARSGPKYDLVLSSGFLAFAAHSGFLKAVEEVSVDICYIAEAQNYALVSYNLYCGSPRFL